MRTSEQVTEIQAALSAMQGELQPALKDSTNPHFKSRYADFFACKGVAQSVMAKHGLSAIQGILSDPDKGWIGVETRIGHVSGQWLESDSWCKPKGLLPQDVGSAVTYLKRYSLCAMLGIVADDDDDANQAQGKNDEPKKEEPKKYQKPVDPKVLDDKYYTGTSTQKKAVKEILAKNAVPEQDYELIHEELMNKEKKHLFDVILKRYEP
jgi:hypothetical protein